MSISNESTYLEEEPFSLLKIIFTLFSIIGIRMFLDKLAYQNAVEYFLPQERAIHASLYYFSIFLSLSILIYLLTKIPLKKILTFLTKTMLFILLVPIVDLIFSMGKTSPPIYLVIKTNDFLLTFFQIINPFSGQGITFGQHIGAYAIFITISLFIYKKTKSFPVSFISIFFGYVILFFDAIIPSIISAFSNEYNMSGQTALDSYGSILKNSWLANNIPTNSTYLDSLFFQATTLNVYHEIVLARFFWILVVFEITLIFFIANKRIWHSLKNDLRVGRLIYWFIIATIGIIINQKMFGPVSLQNPVNAITLLFFFMLIVLNAWLAVFINDAEDIKIDAISNPNRPLVKKEISKQEWNLIQIIFLMLIALGLTALNNATAFMLLFAQATYYLYSSQPLRLKKHFLFSSVLIGFATIFVAMAGFFLVSPDQSFFAFPIKAIVIIGISYALLSNLKDIKDFEGDKNEAMKTIPVTFGLKNSKCIIASLYAIVIVTIPILLKISAMLFPAVCFSLFLFYLFTKKEYQEKYIFLTFFLYVLTFFFVIV